MQKNLSRAVYCKVFVFMLFTSVPLLAIANAEITSSIQMDFTTPGARSVALGGAFVGLADDATSAYTNPAGLTILSKLEISFEARSSDFTTEYIERGNIGTTTGRSFDDIARTQRSQASASIDNLSFLSIVYPRGRLSMALYRHELANYKAAIETQGPFLTDTDLETRLFPVRANLDLDITNLGFALAWKFSESLSIGLGGSIYQFDLASLTQRFDLINDQQDEKGGFWGEPDFSRENVVNRQALKGDDEDFAINAGFLWNIGKGWTLGGVYREGPGFEFETSNEAGPSRSSELLVFNDEIGQFNVPNVLALGISYRPTEALTFAFDYSLLEYSSLTEQTINIFVSQDDTNPASEDSRAATRRLRVEDGEELHFGLEYVFLNLRNPLAIRAGAYYDPDHRISFEGEPGPDSQSRFAKALFFPGEDDVHYSLGFGLVLKQKFQFDVGADFSEVVDRLSFSAVIRF